MQGESARAWPLLEKANRLQRSLFNFDMQASILKACYILRITI